MKSLISTRVTAAALAAASALFMWSVSSASAVEFDKFGFESVSAEVSNEEAGAHPDFLTHLVVKQDPTSPELIGQHFPYAALKDVVVALPPGLVGNLNAVDECDNARFITGKNDFGEGCPLSSQVGIAEVKLIGMEPGLFVKAPIFKLEASDSNTVARFGFLALTVPVFINVRVRSESDYGVTAEVTNMTAEAAVLEVKTILWGVPADSSHDTQRFTPKEALMNKQESPPRSAEHPLAPFLSNPTSCGTPLEVGFAASSYQDPDRFLSYTAPLGTITGC